jgi:hypothetical protein
MADKTTNRRDFLKTGALVAAPLAVAAPAAVLADDGSRARLARLEDERAIGELHREFLRQVNGTGECGAFVARADAVRLEDGLRSIADDPADDGTLELAANGLSASSRRPITVELDTMFTGHSTLEQMARFQGHGSHRRTEQRVMATDYVNGSDGWRIARLTLA